MSSTMMRSPNIGVEPPDVNDGSIESCLKPTMLESRGFIRMFSFKLHSGLRDRAHQLLAVYPQETFEQSPRQALFSRGFQAGVYKSSAAHA